MNLSKHLVRLSWAECLDTFSLTPDSDMLSEEIYSSYEIFVGQI